MTMLWSINSLITNYEHQYSGFSDKKKNKRSKYNFSDSFPSDYKYKEWVKDKLDYLSPCF